MLLTAREAALIQLNAFREKGLQSGSGVEKLNTEYGLNEKDSALAVNIFLGCIQYLYRLDFCIAAVSDFPAGKIDGCVMNILRVSAYQLFFLERIPAHAAVDEGVKLCRKYRPRACAFVNAVLRRLASVRKALPEPAGDAPFKLSVLYSVEEWFAAYLVERYGLDSAEAFLKESNNRAPLSIKINSLRIAPDEYRELLTRNEIPFRNYAYDDILFIDSRDVKGLPGFSEGFFFVQDPAAAACTAISGIAPGMRVLDACSSPGGKAFSAAAAMKNKGCILACDINSKKTAKIVEGAERLGMSSIMCSVCDAKKYNAEFASAFDVVIADVPCSGFGVLRKKPEIKYKSRKEIAALPEIQNAILDNLCRYVRPGGTLLYSTCSVLKEENEQVVERFLTGHGAFRAADFDCCGIRSVDGMYTFLPHVNGTDGFFAAKLVRTCI